jgi:hypothetical protein
MRQHQSAFALTLMIARARTPGAEDDPTSSLLLRHLAPMIARNSVILIDQIGTEIAAGHHPWDAVVIAAIHRTRPILLTASAATPLGLIGVVAALLLAQKPMGFVAMLGVLALVGMVMIPIAPTVFWGPMAFAIIGGLAVATVLTLIFLPALYAAWFRVAEPAFQPSAPAEPALSQPPSERARQRRGAAWCFAFLHGSDELPRSSPVNGRLSSKIRKIPHADGPTVW